MKLPCDIIEDMLPIYYDSVCSKESSEMIEAHLKECPACSAILSNLNVEFDIGKKKFDDISPLNKIVRKWKKSNQISMKKGVCITLSVLLLIASVLIGVWYFGYAKYYFHMANKMEQTPDEDAFFTSSDYTVERDGYRYEVWLPMVLSNSGFVRVMNENGLVMFLYPEYGGNIEVSIMLRDEEGTYIKVWLNTDLSPNYEEHTVPPRTDAEKNKIQKLLTEMEADIIDMFNGIHDIWGIQYLE